MQFDRTPKAPVEARPFPRFREANAAANYTAPPADGSRPGIVQIPLRPERMTKFGLRSLLYHEGVPGHHFQIALEAENRGLPRFRRVRAFGGISALSEGWGLYAERLAAESDWFKDDPIGLLGQLDIGTVPRPPARRRHRASTRSTGRASRRSTTASKRAKSSATSSIPGRRART